MTNDERSADDPVLRVEGVGVSFRGIRALDDVTFAVPSGGITAVIGPNGAGKTTLFNCISGIYAHEGRVVLAGEDVSRLRSDRRAARGITRTFQTPVLIPELTALENVLIGAYPHTRGGVAGSILRLPGVRADERRAREEAVALLDRLHFPVSVDAPVGALPHGDRRRVEVARALIGRPKVLLLDEPAAGLGAEEAESLVEEVSAVGEARGSTCILVEHDVALVRRVARHVVVLDAGRLLAQGDPETVGRDPKVVAAYLGDDWAAA
jgi:branched-chain amino acid transport system ATP-binding protein